MAIYKEKVIVASCFSMEARKKFQKRFAGLARNNYLKEKLFTRLVTCSGGDARLHIQSVM